MIAWIDGWFGALGPGMLLLLTVSWQASVLVVIVLAVQAAFGRWLSARWRYALWSVVVLRLVLPVTPGSAVSVFNLFRGDPGAGSEVMVAELPAGSVAEPMGAVDLSGFDAVAYAAGVGAVGPVNPVSPWEPWGTADIVLAVWLAGVGLVLGVLILINFILALRLRPGVVLDDPGLLELVEACKHEMGVKRGVRLIVDRKITSPALAGVFRPTLLIPPGLIDELSREELRFVLLHELAHVKKRDIAMNWLLIVLSALHWFNPLVWFAFSSLRADRELARDAMVLRAVGADASRAYGQTIIHILERLTRPRLNNPALAGIGDGMGQLKRRLRMIALSPKRRPALTLVGASLLVTLAAIGLTDAAEPIDEVSEDAGTVTQSDEVADLWNQVLVGTNKARSRIHSIEAEYVTDIYYPPGAKIGNKGVTHKREKTRWVNDDKRYYLKYELELSGPELETSAWFEIAYDGKRCERRVWNLADHIAIVDDGRGSGFTPLQLFTLNLNDTQVIQDKLADGSYVLADEKVIDSDTGKLYEITLDVPERGTRFEIQYDPRRAFLPIRSRRFNAQNQLESELVIEKVAKVADPAGNIHLIPVEGVGRSPENANTQPWMKAVDVDSIRINEPAEGFLYSLSARYPDAKVVDTTEGDVPSNAISDEGHADAIDVRSDRDRYLPAIQTKPDVTEADVLAFAEPTLKEHYPDAYQQHQPFTAEAVPNTLLWNVRPVSGARAGVPVAQVRVGEQMQIQSHGLKGITDTAERETESNGGVEGNPDWRSRFDAVYRLNEGEVVRRVAPPYIPERTRFYHLRAHTTPPGAKPPPPDVYYFRWNNKLEVQGMMFGAGMSIERLLNYVLDLYTYEYEGDRALLGLRISGDWIYDFDAEGGVKRDALVRVIEEATGKRLRFTLTSMERDVVVAAGLWEPATLVVGQGDGLIHVYSGDQFDPDEQQGVINGDLDEFFRRTAWELGVRIEDRVTERPEGWSLAWKWYSSSRLHARDMSDEQRSVALRSLLDHLEKQTGLTFTVEKRVEDVWVVGEEE